jgi:protein-tyrosine phosphatase
MPVADAQGGVSLTCPTTLLRGSAPQAPAFIELIPVIDLHSHILPGIDDGAADVSVSVAMARAFVADGVTHVACTPHILPGVYHNTGPQIRQAVGQLQRVLDDNGIPLRLVTGADNHVVPDFVAGLRAGHLLSLADTRYVLVEPPHHVAPPRLEDMLFSLMTVGFVPILTHPERLSWIRSQYGTFERLARAGVWMQITAGSLAGAFGKSAQYWAQRMLEEGRVHVLATDAHDTTRRPPNLSVGRDLAAARVGGDEAEHLVSTRPRGVLANVAPSDLPLPTAVRGPSFDEDRPSRSRDDDAGSEGRRDNGLRGLTRRLRRFFG